jgi:tungstate transport system substrate-binding protein
MGMFYAGVILMLLIAGCAGQPQEKLISGPEKEPARLVLATTTSTYNSGLLDVLNPVFQEKFNALVEVHSLGTGKAIKMARDGEADLLLVHARGKEDVFLEEGYGVNRRDVMFNDFVIVGPRSDPAGILGSEKASEAFKKIAHSRSLFFSRGDNSGTHTKEREIWKLAGIEPEGEWYQATGQGMGNTLTIANEKRGYTITDRGTYLAYQGKIDLEILLEGPVKGGDELLSNPYAVIAVNPAKYPNRNYQLAMAYIGFITSPEGQKLIGDYKKNGEQLFYPSAIRDKENYDQYLPVTIKGGYRGG